MNVFSIGIYTSIGDRFSKVYNNSQVVHRSQDFEKKFNGSFQTN